MAQETTIVNAMSLWSPSSGDTVTIQARGAATDVGINIDAKGDGIVTFNSSILVGSAAADPAGGANGQVYYNTVTDKFRAYEDGAWVDMVGGGGGGSGTVTSFSAGDLSPLFTTSEATATTTPALSFTLVNQNANIIYAGPTNGVAASPTFRALVLADFAANLLTYAKLQQVSAASRLLGNSTGAAGNIEELQIGATLQFSGNTLNTVAISGDVTSAANSFATTIANSVVTFAKIQDLTTQKLVGRYAGTDGVMQYITLGTLLTLDTSTGVLNVGVAAASDLVTGTNNTKAVTSLAFKGFRDLARTACSVVTTTMTLDMSSKQELRFENTTAVSSNFTIAFSNETNIEVMTLDIYVTGTVVITLPSTVIMQKSETRWNNSTKQLTLTGVTAEPFELSFTKSDGPKYKLKVSDVYYTS